jgi:hypothetical protein
MDKFGVGLGLALVESASSVAALGCSQAEIDSLDDASVVAGMQLIREHKRTLQAYELWLATAVARRSDHEFGDQGLARRNGSATSREFIQSITGTSLDEATKLARLGELAVESPDSTGVVDAATQGAVSVDAADAIRRGLGRPDSAISAEQLRVESEKLIDRAPFITPEELFKLARQTRNGLDLDAVERGQKRRADLRYVRRFRRDGMCGGSWLLPEEDGGLEIDTALQLLLASRTGGPRFPALDASGELSATGKLSATGEPIAPDPRIEDTRTNEQILADGFAQVFHNGIAADPSVIPGAQRAAVRVVVTDTVLDAGVGSAFVNDSAFLEDTMTAITFGKLGEHLCEGGTVGIMFDDNGNVLNVGREQRLFTARQRIGLAVRDGGCRFPGCRKPPSWTEAHHIDHWARDQGRTDIARGILLCRYHHMLIHNNSWEIKRDDGGRYLLSLRRASTSIRSPSRCRARIGSWLR